MSFDFPFEFHSVKSDLAQQYSINSEDITLVGPKRYCVKKTFQSIAGHLHNLEIRPSDVWIYGYPRSGTTMAQEIVWLIGNDLNYERAAREVMNVRFPVLDREMFPTVHYYDKVLKEPHKYKDYLIPIVEKLSDPSWITLKNETERRFIKTHLPFSLGPRDILNSGCKIFFLARNPKDVIISNYFILQSYNTLNGTSFEQFWQQFKQGLAQWCPYFELLKEGWSAAKAHPEHVKFLFYEDYKNDMRKTLVQIATFLEKTLTALDLDKLEEHMKIENFRKNKSVNNDYLRDLGSMSDKPNGFIRNGKADGWKDYLTDAINEDMDLWIQENLKDPALADFKFPHLHEVPKCYESKQSVPQ